MNKIIVEKTDEETRLDQFLFQKNPDYSRSYFHDLVKVESVFVNDLATKNNYRVRAGDVVEFDLIEKPALGPVEPENISLDIIFENDDVAVIDKPAGLVVHPAAGNFSGTLVNALAYKFPEIKEAVHQEGNGLSESRPGLVHRLDKNTSGILIVAKNTKAMIFLSNQIKDRRVKKIYQAICAGWPKAESGRLINYLGRDAKNRKSYAEVGREKGREAISNFKVIEHYKTEASQKVSLLEFDIETGRTHQIRVQAKIAGFPVIGDNVYFTKESKIVSTHLGTNRQMLHAKSLSIKIPGGSIAQTFQAPVPADFSAVLTKLTPQN